MANSNGKATERNAKGQFVKGNKEGNRFKKDDQFTVESGSKGGKVTQEKNAELKKAVDILEMFLKRQATNVKGETLNYKEVGLLKLVQAYINGEKWAIELVLKLLGELVDKQSLELQSPTQIILKTRGQSGND